MHRALHEGWHGVPNQAAVLPGISKTRQAVLAWA
jgi:hypothetical protein